MNCLNISLEQTKDIAVIIGVLVTLITLIIGVLEFRRQGKIKRVEKFLEMRRKFKENSDFKNIFELIENDDKEFENISWELKLNLLGFFEEIALLVNSNIIKKRITHYMFLVGKMLCICGLAKAGQARQQPGKSVKGRTGKFENINLYVLF